MISFRIFKLGNGDYKAMAQNAEGKIDLAASFQSPDWHNFQTKLRDNLDKKIPGAATERRKPKGNP